MKISPKKQYPPNNMTQMNRSLSETIKIILYLKCVFLFFFKKYVFCFKLTANCKFFFSVYHNIRWKFNNTTSSPKESEPHLSSVII